MQRLFKEVAITRMRSNKIFFEEHNLIINSTRASFSFRRKTRIFAESPLSPPLLLQQHQYSLSMFGSIGLIRDRRDLQRSWSLKRHHTTQAAAKTLPVGSEEDVFQQQMATSPSLQKYHTAPHDVVIPANGQR
jgi:hypothetical protein